jgi:excisionase family DNA binding protein
MTEEPWVDVERVAAHLAVTRDVIYRWIKQRDFPARRVGRLFRFRLSEVDEWVRGGSGTVASHKKAPMRK